MSQVELTCEKCGCESARVSHQLDVLPRLSAYSQFTIHLRPSREHMRTHTQLQPHTCTNALAGRGAHLFPTDHGYTCARSHAADGRGQSCADVCCACAGSWCCISSGSRSTRRSVPTRSRMRMCAAATAHVMPRSTAVRLHVCRSCGSASCVSHVVGMRKRTHMCYAVWNVRCAHHCPAEPHRILCKQSVAGAIRTSTRGAQQRTT